MHILFIASEAHPFSTSGELGEYVGTLAQALRTAGAEVTLISPFYSDVDGDHFGLARRLRKVAVDTGDGQTVEVGMLDGKFPGADVQAIFIDHPSFHRAGLYGDGRGPFEDNLQRFNLLCRGALRLAEEFELQPDIIHAFDWQTGLALLLPASITAKRVFTVHDANFAGTFPKDAMQQLGLDPTLFTPEGVEFHGQLSLLKAGIIAADAVTAPSPAYARELTTEAQGAGLHGLFSSLGSRLYGISGGIDYNGWDPANDHRIAAEFGLDSMAGKAQCKRALQESLGLPLRAEQPLAAAFGPFEPHRGADLLLQALPMLAEKEVQLLLVGHKGAGAAALLDAAKTQPTVAHLHHVNEDKLHSVLAGVDAVLLPQTYEPGGILPLQAQRYGAVPVAHAVGFLADIIADFDPPSRTGTGITFTSADSASFGSALHRLVTLFNEPSAWRQLTHNAMRQRVSCEQTAQRMLGVYETLTRSHD